MTYQSTAADTPYSGDLYNLNPDAVDIMSILKASFKAASFVVTQSGDGLSTYSTSADILTNQTSTSGNQSNNGNPGREKVANSIANNSAWFIVKPNASATHTGQLAVQLIDFDSGTYQIRVKFSAGGFVNATNAAQTPAPTTANDEKYCVGGGTDASPTGSLFTYSDGLFRCNTTFDDSISTPRGWFGLWPNASDSAMFLLLWDYGSNFGGSDTYPYAVYAGVDVTAADLAKIADQSVTQDTQGWATKRGSGLTEKTGGLYEMGVGLSAGGPGGPMGTNTAAAKDDLIPVHLHRCAENLASPTGHKHYSTMIRWVPTNQPNGDHFDAPTGGDARDLVVFQKLALPWAVPSIPCVR